MYAINLTSPFKIGIKDVPNPQCKDDDILIKVEAAGICGSDIAAYRGTSPLCTYPRILGHEISGKISAKGQNVRAFKIGQRVVLEPYIYCGKCYPCQIGRTNCCENLKVLGVHTDGGMQEYFVHPAHLVHAVPDSMTPAEAACVEPLTIALHAINRLQLKAGEHVVIFGAGPIGNLAAQISIYKKARPIIIDLISQRLELLKGNGVEHLLNPQNEDVVDRIKHITKGRMAECVVEASGSEIAVRATIDVVAHAGRIALVGHPKNEVTLPTSLFTKKELDVRGSRNSVKEFQAAIDLILNNHVDTSLIRSKVVPLTELPDFLKLQHENPKDYLKIIGIAS